MRRFALSFIFIAMLSLLIVGRGDHNAFAVTPTPTPTVVGVGTTAYNYQKTVLDSTTAGLVVKPLAAQQTVGNYSIRSLSTNTTNALCDWFNGSPPVSPGANAREVTPGEVINDSMPAQYGPGWLGMVCWLKSGATTITINAQWRK